jgi:plasmid stabilization system protein ParE
VKTDFSPAALADLEEIGLYIARHNPRAAAAWVDKLVDRAEKAAAQPRSGRVVPEVGDPDIREVLLRTYRIIYRIEPGRILVLTIMEGHRRLRSLPGGAKRGR